MLTTVKGRALTDGEVCVYFDLRTSVPTWSVTAVKGSDNRGELLAKADTVTLTGARMVVKESRRQAIAAGGHREVCAWVIGKLSEDCSPEGLERIRFAPRERDSFHTADGSRDVWHADAVVFHTDGKAYAREAI